MTTQAPRDNLTVAQAAEFLGVSSSTIRRWIDRRRLPAERIGQRRIRIRRDDLFRVVSPLGASSAGKINFARRLTQTEVEQTLAALESARQLREEILAKRGGVPLPDSVKLIQEMRDERTPT